MKLFKITYFIIITLYLISFFQIKKLPPKTEINKNLYNKPIQEKTERKEFNFDYKKYTYTVTPQANYELWGLVVSKNNINAWYNFYHDKNTVNIKDLCVVWRENIISEVYRDPNISFKNGEWTCYYSWNSQLISPFYPNKLSNNHLLASDYKIQKIIKQTNVGDQIYFKGILADYQKQGENFIRQTSLSREDSNQSSRSGGACEVVFVDEFKILKNNQLLWNYINRFGLKIIIIIFLINIFILFFKLRKKSFIYN